MAITTPLDKFRLELGDIDEDTPLFNDDEAEYFIAKHPDNVLLQVADACDALAARLSRDFDFDTSSGSNATRSFKRSQAATAYAARAKRLRERAAGEGVDAAGNGTGVPLYNFPSAYPTLDGNI